MHRDGKIPPPAPTHEGLLRPTADPPGPGPAVASWFRSVAERGHKVVALRASPLLGDTAAGVPALEPEHLHPSGAPTQLVRRALAEGFRGLGILIWADRVIADTSDGFHQGIEAALTDLCVDHPVSVLCVYDRPGAGTDCLGMAVAHHAAALHEQQLGFHSSPDVVRLSGEVDATNLDVVAAALRAAAAERRERLRIDLSGATFLSAAAAQLLHEHVAALRAEGTRVELEGVAPHIDRILRLVALHFRSTR